MVTKPANKILSALDVVEMIKEFIKNHDDPVIYAVYDSNDGTSKNNFLDKVLARVYRDCKDQYTKVKARSNALVFDVVKYTLNNCYKDILVLGTVKQTERIRREMPLTHNYYILPINKNTCNFESAMFWTDKRW